jgi:hypothetical protein
MGTTTWSVGDVKNGKEASVLGRVVIDAADLMDRIGLRRRWK